MTSPAGRRVTMRQVAAAAGVSLQTVSNLINGRTTHMTPATERRVREIVDELGYRPNLAARSLRSARVQALAFLVVDASARFLADPMTDLFLAGLGDELRERDHALLIQACPPSERFEGLLAPLVEGRADAAALFLSGAPALRATIVDRLRRLELPTLLLQEHHTRGHAAITAADREGSRDLCRHLLARGHERLSFLTAADSWSAIEERIAGFEDAHREAGIRPADGAIIRHGTYAPLDAAEATRTLLESADRPTALLCANDLIALGALKAARAAGLRVPQDLAVAGFDDFEFAAAVDPPLTTVRIPGYEMGRQAARSLLSAVAAGAAAESHRFPVEVQLRASA